MKCILLIIVLALTLDAFYEVESKSQSHRPHIIFIYADDLGWGDLSLHGSPEIPTPNIDALAMNGLLLNEYYGQWLCTPSRAALMSGKYPIHTGFQHMLIVAGQPAGLPLDIVTLPQYLKQLGYKNHMIGKWHLGQMTKDYFPTRRGFDSFFGYFNGYIDYYDYTHFGTTNNISVSEFFGVDLYNDTTLIKDFRGPYATDVFTEKAKHLIRHHNSHTPLFLYFSHLAVHGSSPFKPDVAPPQYMKRVRHIPDPKRRIHAARTIALDDSVGEVFQALHQKGMLDNSIVLFVSDNGGEANSIFNMHASNFPLRGSKQTPYEGGIRIPALIWSPLLKESRISNQLMSVTDWLPTLYSAAGGDSSIIQDIDGIDMWNALQDDTPSPRQELLYIIDPIDGCSALRKRDFKVLNGSSEQSHIWYNKPTFNCYNTNPQSKNCNFEEKSVVRNILEQKGMWVREDIVSWRKNAAIACTDPPAQGADGCKPNEKPCLFDLSVDPCEHKNIADQHPDVVNELMDTINRYAATAVKPQWYTSDVRANPECHDFAFVPWMEPEYYQTCEYYT